MSAGLNYPGHQHLYIKQALAAAGGFLLLFIFKNFSYKFLEELSPFFYIITLILLFLVLLYGSRVHGSIRWFNLGLFSFQPSEFSKFAFIIFTAYLLQRKNSILIPFLVMLSVTSLIIVQPDAGTALLFLPVFIGMLSVSRLNLKWLGGIIILGMVALTSLFLQSYLYFKGSTLIQLRYLLIPFVISSVAVALFGEARKVNKKLSYRLLAVILFLFWTAAGTGLAAAVSLKEYQRKRIVSFMIPELDPMGVGYSTRQSLLAVGSGRFGGKGLFRGTQIQLGFLPARHNDFIFAAIAEETGFIGSLTLLFILGLLALQMIKIINRTEDYGGRLVAAGVFSLFISQVAVNIFVVTGLMPVMGVQLPFVSYGGSGLVLFFILTGLILNVNRRSEVIGV